MLVIPFARVILLVQILCWTCPQPRFKVDEKVGLSSATVTIASYSSRCPSITAGAAIMVPETKDVENKRYTIFYVFRIFDLAYLYILPIAGPNSTTKTIPPESSTIPGCSICKYELPRAIIIKAAAV